MFCLCRPKASEADDESLIFDPLDTPQERIIKMVLLGPSDSGKTTIIHQFRKITDSIDESDMINITSCIKERIVVQMKELCHQSLILEQQCLRLVSPFSVHPDIQHLRADMLSLPPSAPLTPQIALTIQKLWNDNGVKATLQQRHRFQMDENVAYFLNKMESIAKDDYVPDFSDYVHFRRKTSGYCTSTFVKDIPNLGECRFEVHDIGGARCERKKWWNHHLLSDMEFDAVLYTVPISDYDLKLFENNCTNRLVDALRLFEETMIKTDFLHETPLFLVFNKYDVFLDKIKDIPITCCFDDFPEHRVNPNDAEKVIRFIAGKFLQIFSKHGVELKGPLKILKSTAIDTESVRNMFDRMVPQIIRQKVTVSRAPEDSISN